MDVDLHTGMLIYSNFLGGSILEAKIHTQKKSNLITSFNILVHLFILLHLTLNTKIGYLNKQATFIYTDIDTFKNVPSRIQAQ